MKKAIIVLLALSSLIQLHAQNPGSALYLMPAFYGFAFDNMNQMLMQAGFSEAPLAFGSGAGGFGSIGNWRIGGEGTYLSGSASRGQNATTLSGGLGYFYGARVWQLKKWNLVPAAGLGFGGLTMAATRPTTAGAVGALLGAETQQ
jgi:hypothetical protein